MGRKTQRRGVRELKKIVLKTCLCELKTIGVFFGVLIAN